ncbi:hypothetical protein [Paraburkholderia acidiphila]|uniref:Uncharacterized protein n=1 Tax=Paraburkholderia acidiphila TaxID=2571747 RepID=A0A7Z2G5G3_9BURK|nr:hypothetical protein [Paraburkholderia acidiphila]QGZ55406.1 hypothetical protein FAZ97_11070 [Paraburkholderia acidiphila]
MSGEPSGACILNANATGGAPQCTPQPATQQLAPHEPWPLVFVGSPDFVVPQ